MILLKLIVSRNLKFVSTVVRVSDCDSLSVPSKCRWKMIWTYSKCRTSSVRILREYVHRTAVPIENTPARASMFDLCTARACMMLWNFAQMLWKVYENVSTVFCKRRSYSTVICFLSPLQMPTPFLLNESKPGVSSGDNSLSSAAIILKILAAW